MQPAPLLTPTNFPPYLKDFLTGLPRPRIVLPQPYVESIRLNSVVTQWHELPQYRQRQEQEVPKLLQDFPETIVSLEGAGRFLVLQGAFMHRPLVIKKTTHILSTSWLVLVPSSYPNQMPIIWFCWEQDVETDARLHPVRFREGAYRQLVPDHTLADYSACVAMYEADAKRYGAYGWNPGYSTLGDFLAWSAQYLARREYFLAYGKWLSDKY